VSAATGITIPTDDQPGRRVRLPRIGPTRVLLILLGVIAVLSVVRVISGANDIDSSGSLNAAVTLAVPIGLAGLGGLWSERAGIVNIGLEGMLILGTWGAGWAGYQWGPWAGVGMAIVMGAIGGLVHAIATVGFGVDHIVSGVAITILAGGTVQYLSDEAFTGVPGGGGTQSPPIGDLPALTIPGVSDQLLTIEKHHWFFVSDLAAALRALTFDLSSLTIIAVLLVVASFFVLWRTSFGLRLRACGESPWAAESLGVNVYRYKALAVVASGALAGLGGGFLAIVASSQYREGQTGGRGYIGLAAMIFGNWRPGGLVVGAGLFGYTDALQLRSGGESVHALLLVMAVLLIGAAVWAWVRARKVQSVVAAVLGVAVLIWYFSTKEIPAQFTQMTPYVATLLVLAAASQRLRMPAADGIPYRKGQGG
jgi:ABC-type uncharacterized transport system permease subunit